MYTSQRVQSVPDVCEISCSHKCRSQTFNQAALQPGGSDMRVINTSQHCGCETNADDSLDTKRVLCKCELDVAVCCKCP